MPWKSGDYISRGSGVITDSQTDKQTNTQTGITENNTIRSAISNHWQCSLSVRVFRNVQSSIGHLFLIHESKLQLYEQYIKASPRSAMTLQTWKKKDAHFNKLITLFQVLYANFPFHVGYLSRFSSLSHRKSSSSVVHSGSSQRLASQSW